MMIEPQVWLPLVSGLIGALVGGAASTVTVIVQARLEAKRYRLGVVTDMAKHEINKAYELATRTNRPVSIVPPVVFMRYYDELLRALEAGNLTLDRYRRIMANSREFVALTRELSDETTGRSN